MGDRVIGEVYSQSVVVTIGNLGFPKNLLKIKSFWKPIQNYFNPFIQYIFFYNNKFLTIFFNKFSPNSIIVAIFSIQ